MPIPAEAPDQRPRMFTARSIAVPGQEGDYAFVTLGERIVAVGERGQLRSRFPDVDLVDLDGVLLPAFNDAHMHPSKAADYGLVANLAPPAVGDRDDLFAVLRRQAGRVDLGEWIRGARYDHGKSSGGEFITRHDLIW